jgi:hypothetical protein
MALSNHIKLFDTANPLDIIQDVLTSKNWIFNRIDTNELIVQVTGKSCDYRLIFLWQEDMNAIQFYCQYDIHIEAENFDTAAKTLMSINEKLWMGHFDLPSDTGIPAFRQTSLIHDEQSATAAIENVESMLDISLTQCERYCSAFQMLAKPQKGQNITPLNDQSMSLALMETIGES